MITQPFTLSAAIELYARLRPQAVHPQPPAIFVQVRRAGAVYCARLEGLADQSFDRRDLWSVTTVTPTCGRMVVQFFNTRLCSHLDNRCACGGEVGCDAAGRAQQREHAPAASEDVRC